jgi:putative hemolysin
MRYLFWRWRCRLPPVQQQRHLMPETAARGYGEPGLVYCLEKGGEQVPVQSPQGVRTECKLPGGEVIDEWTLYRRDHPQPAR